MTAATHSGTPVVPTREGRNALTWVHVAFRTARTIRRRIPGHYYNFDAYNQYSDFTGEPFPSAPEWQGTVDGQYEWTLHNDIKAFVGFTLDATSSTNTFFVNHNPIPAFANAGASGVLPVFGGFINCAGVIVPAPVGHCPFNVLTSVGVGVGHPNDPLNVPGYALMDLRAGVHSGPWFFQIWGRNVTNTWYWYGAYHVNDVLLRYTGMPTTYGVTFSYRFH